MIHSFKKILQYGVFEVDGELGIVDDLFFDERDEKIKYFVIETGGWLNHHKVLLSPKFIKAINWDNKQIILQLTKQQLIDCPDITEYPPESWHQKDFSVPIKMKKLDIIHLKSAKEILNYKVEMSNGEMGKVFDYEINDVLWIITRFIVDCGNWFNHKYKEVFYAKVKSIRWYDQTIHMNMTVKELELAPNVDPEEYAHKDSALEAYGPKV